MGDNKGGRPSTYNPAFCERVIDLGRQGTSPAQISAVIDIPRTTMLRWADEHEEFRTALSRAKDLEQAWWEDQAMAGLVANRFNALVWKKSVEARFRHDYTERSESKTTLSADGTITGLMERIAANGRRIQDKPE